MLQSSIIIRMYFRIPQHFVPHKYRSFISWKILSPVSYDCRKRFHPLSCHGAIPHTNNKLFFTSHLNINLSKSAAISEDVDDRGETVYVGTVGGKMRAIKIFSLGTSFLSLCSQPFILFSIDSNQPVGITLYFTFLLNLIVMTNPVIIHFISKKYVTELFWNRSTDVFTAAIWSFFARRKEIHFVPDDVDVPFAPGMLTTFHAKGIPLFVDEKSFQMNEAYIHLMGYDKPIDWQVDVSENSNTKTIKKKKI